MHLFLIGFLFSFLSGAVWLLIKCLMSALGPLRVDGHVSFLRQIPVVAATIWLSNFRPVVSFHPGELNRGHVALDGTNTPGRQELGSVQAIPGATFSKLLSHTKTIWPGQVLLGRGLLIDRASDWSSGRQS